MYLNRLKDPSRPSSHLQKCSLIYHSVLGAWLVPHIFFKIKVYSSLVLLNF